MQQVSNDFPKDSLVKYENPIELTSGAQEGGQGEFPKPRVMSSTMKKKTLPPVEGRPSTEDILNAVLPPREWNESGKHFIQYVSHQPPSRVDVGYLMDELNKKLMERQARESGICPVREELFSQCFDEIIRQVTLDNPERGLLLLRVRDELKMTIAAYQTLYQSSVTFGMRKQLQAEHGKADLEKKINELEVKQTKLQNKVIELKSKMEAIDKRNKERRKVEAEKRKNEQEFLRYQEKHLSTFLKNLEQKS